MTTAPKVLIADDDASIRLVLSHAFARAGFQVRATGAVQALLKWAADGEGDVLVTDVLMPDENMLEVLPRLRRLRPTLPIIVMSAQNTLLTAVAAAERGAFEYMPKPFDLDEIVAAARRALASTKAPPAAARQARDARTPLLGRSPAMQAVYRGLARLMATDLPVLITGETGSGKTLAARVLHDLGPRRETPIVELRMAGLAGSDLEARLRSVVRGGEGAAGSLVLDEVGDLPLEAQARLVGLLDDLYDQIESEPQRQTPRLVATTSRDLISLCAEGAFRDDLRHRLAVAVLHMPPLRDHTEDVGEMARAFLASAAPSQAAQTAPAGQSTKPRGESTLDAEALKRLEGYDWPGNVRELQNVLRRLAAFSPALRITGEVLEREFAPGVADRPDRSDAMEGHFSEAVAAVFAGPRPEPGLHDRMTAALERPLLQAALSHCDGNQVRAAELLGLNRNTLRKRLQDLGLRSRG